MSSHALLVCLHISLLLISLQFTEAFTTCHHFLCHLHLEDSHSRVRFSRLCLAFSNDERVYFTSLVHLDRKEPCISPLPLFPFHPIYTFHILALILPAS